jgi:hypothetical protein
MRSGVTHRRSDNRAAVKGWENRKNTREEINVRMLSQHTATTGRDSSLTKQQNAMLLVEGKQKYKLCVYLLCINYSLPSMFVILHIVKIIIHSSQRYTLQNVLTTVNSVTAYRSCLERIVHFIGSTLK